MIACIIADAWTPKDFLTILFPMVSAVFLGYVAWQQWRTNHLKVQHDLFERRIAVFTALMEFLVPIFSDVNVDERAANTFLQKTRESYFLFGEDIADYLKLIHDKATDLQCLHSQIHESNQLPDEERNRLINERKSIKTWFNEQPLVARVKFAKRLKLY
jgi:hypothetical protein